MYLKRIGKAFILPLLVLLLHGFLYAFGAYSSLPWVDIPMHFLGGFSIAFMSISLLRLMYASRYLSPLPLAFFFVFVLSFVALIAVLWEFFEWGIDVVFRSATQGGLEDTLGDLFFGLLGGFFGFFYPNARR